MGYKVFILTTVALNESNLFWSEMTVRKSYCELYELVLIGTL